MAATGRSDGSMAEHASALFSTFLANPRNTVAHHLDTFDAFVDFDLDTIFRNEPDLNITLLDGNTLSISLYDPSLTGPIIVDENAQGRRVERPSYPTEMRLRDETYEGALHINIRETLYAPDGTVLHCTHHLHQRLCFIPIMVKSSRCNLHLHTRESRTECPNDPGGYFIVKGRERVLVSQIRAAYNLINVVRKKVVGKEVVISATCRSMSASTSHSILLKVHLTTQDLAVLTLHYLRDEVPLGLVLRALDVADLAPLLMGLPKTAEAYVATLQAAFDAAPSASEARVLIGRLSTLAPVSTKEPEELGMQILELEMLPHLGVGCTNEDRAMFLGRMHSKLVMTKLGVRSEDDRDNLRFKRVEGAGALLRVLFWTLLKRFLKVVKQIIAKKSVMPASVPALLTGLNLITINIRQCMLTGAWGASKSGFLRIGVAQVLSRQNYIATISHLRRLSLPVGRQGKNVRARMVNASHACFICPLETPEGGTTGVVLNLASTTTITCHVSSEMVSEIICQGLCTDTALLLRRKGYSGLLTQPGAAVVLVDGRPIAATLSPALLVLHLDAMRRDGVLPRSVSAWHDPVDGEVHLACDEGRLLRPVLVASRMSELGTEDARQWEHCLVTGLVDYVDPAKAEASVVAMWPSEAGRMGATFCEIVPEALCSLVTNCIPFMNSTQAARNLFWASMGKQATGVPTLNQAFRTDTSMLYLNTPQRPLVDTDISRHTGFDAMPCGVNAIVAVATLSGYNQEDSLIMNRASIERGMFRSTHFKTIATEERNRSSSVTEIIRLPPGHIRKGYQDYSLLDADGIVQPGVRVRCGTVLVGKVEVGAPGRRAEGVALATPSVDDVDISLVAQVADEGIVDRVLVTTTRNRFRLVKVILRMEKVPETGDKFASRSAQKGTVGLVEDDVNLPFCPETGMIPDIIINPLCLPSRMTVNQLQEMVLGKARCVDGEAANATAFSGPYGTSSSGGSTRMEDICNRLAAAGYERHGWHRMVSGKTGEPIKARIFMGPAYYHRLRHMVADKVHARSHGEVTILTRQPLSGRRRDGGLRVRLEQTPPPTFYFSDSANK